LYLVWPLHTKAEYHYGTTMYTEHKAIYLYA
jgi:hypothetical protein